MKLPIERWLDDATLQAIAAADGLFERRFPDAVRPCFDMCSGLLGVRCIEACNSHDLDRILAHDSDDSVMASPRIAPGSAGRPPG
jgi:hypothetical protein